MVSTITSALVGPTVSAVTVQLSKVRNSSVRPNSCGLVGQIWAKLLPAQIDTSPLTDAGFLVPGRQNPHL